MLHVLIHTGGRIAAVLVAVVLLALGASVVDAAPDHPYTRVQDPTTRSEEVPAVAPPTTDPPSAVEAPPAAEAAPLSEKVPELLPGRVDEIFIELVPARSDADIAGDLGRARDKQSIAERVLTEARSNEARAKAQIDVQKSTIDHLKSQAKLAKEEERDADRLELERKRKMEELVLKVFQRHRDLRKSEKNYAEALRGHAKQAIETYQVEMRLFEARADRDAFRSAGSTDLTRAASMERQIRALESDALEVMKDLADKEAKVAQNRRTMMDQRQKVFEAQRAVRTAQVR